MLRCCFICLCRGPLSSNRPNPPGIRLESMVTSNLQLAEFDRKSFDEFFKGIIWVTHELLSLLFCHGFEDKYVWHFEIWEEQDKDSQDVSWDFYKIDCAADVMEITVEDFPLWVYLVFFEAFDGHRWWSFASDDVNLVLLWRISKSASLLLSCQTKAHRWVQCFLELLLVWFAGWLSEVASYLIRLRFIC